jgi:hypothetical protein
MVSLDAKRLLTSTDAHGLTLMVACDVLTSGACFAWETDTLLTYLESENCLPDEDSRDRLLAMLAIRLNPAHLWDGFVFSNVATALAGTACFPEIMEECSVAELCWAVTELREMSNQYTLSHPEYGDEPAVYAAAVCSKNSLVVIPPELSFCEQSLGSMPSVEDPASLREKVIQKLSQDIEVDEECPACTQAMVLREAGHYVEVNRSKLLSDLALLRA